MSMIGYYVAVDAKKLAEIQAGEADMFTLDPGVYQALDIDKSWQAILYLLCGDLCDGEPPMGYVVPMMEDNAIDCDLDFGAFHLSASQVAKAADYLCSVDDAALKKRYDFDAMVEDGVYPVMEGEDPEEFFLYMMLHLKELKEFYREAAAKGSCVIFYIL